MASWTDFHDVETLAQDDISMEDLEDDETYQSTTSPDPEDVLGFERGTLHRK